MGKQTNRKNSREEDKQNVNPTDALVKQRKEEILTLAKNAPEKIRPYVERYAAQASQCSVWIEVTVLPLVFVAFEYCRQLWKKLEPYWTQGNLSDIIPAIIGFKLCFFGGTFPLLIAAVEAFRLTGYEGLTSAIQDLYDEGHKAWEAHLKDEAKDDDGDGVPDNQQISGSARVKRKTLLILRTADPSRVDNAIKHLIAGQMSILMALKMDFARSVTLGTSIAEVLNKVVSRKVTPLVETLCPDHKKWVPIVLSYICKCIAISIAFALQRVISGFHSAIRGGQLFGAGVVKFAHRKGFINFDTEDSYLDETAGYVLAAVGFLWQLSTGFRAPFPLNLLFFPLTICEYTLELVITFL